MNEMLPPNEHDQLRESWVSRNPKKTITLFLLVVLFFSDLTATVGYRYITKGTIAKRVSIEPDGLRTRHKIYHHDLNPNHSVPLIKWRDENYSFFTNSLGFRDKAVRSISLDTEKPRILFMGDSFTEGAAVDYADSFVGLIDSHLGDEIDVLNAGVVSYSPAIYFLKTQYLIKQIGLSFDHLVVAIDISDIIDDGELYKVQDEKIIFNGYSPSGFRQSWFMAPLLDFLHDYTTIGRLFIHYSVKAYEMLTQKGGKHFRTKEEKSLGAGRPEGLWTINEFLYSDFGKAGLESSNRHLTLLNDLLKDESISMTIVVYPWPDQILHNDLHSIQVEFWEKWAKEQSVNFINLFPLFIKAGQSKSERITTIKTYYFEADVHWNKKGNLLVAKKILDQLKIK